MEDIIIGSHVSFKKDTQLLGSLEEALSYGANTFMFYTGAPQNTSRVLIDDAKTYQAFKLMKENNIDLSKIIVHAPYIINLANDGVNYDFAIRFLQEEIDRCEQLQITMLVLHPGSHVSLGVDIGIQNVINALNIVVTKETKVNICLETMAGKGSEVGSSFNELKQIIDGINYQDKIKVCLDTCHINDAGYDINNFDEVLKEFDSIIGLNKLACIHINDSKNALASHKDRHANFGFGTIGFDNLIHVIYHDKLKGIPKILETPYISLDDNSKDRLFPPYKYEIDMIRKKEFNHNLLEEIRNYYK